MNMTPGMAAIMRVLSRGIIPAQELRKLDQRPLRAIFLKGWMHLTRDLDGVITERGDNAWSEFQRRPILRSDPTRPIFRVRTLHRRRYVA